jgi:hypothetical protein
MVGRQTCAATLSGRMFSQLQLIREPREKDHFY